MLKPLLRVVEAGGRTVDDPTEEVLHDLLSEMAGGVAVDPDAFSVKDYSHGFRLLQERSVTRGHVTDADGSRSSRICRWANVGRSLTCAATYFNAVMWRFRSGSPGATFRAGTDAGRRSTTGSGFERIDLHGSTSRRGDVSWLRGTLPSSTSNGVVITGRRRTMSSFSNCVCASTAV